MKSADTFLADYERPRVAKLGPNLFAACFSLMKLIPARFILARAAASGALDPGGRIVETTSGTFGLALAMLSAAQEYNLTLVSADTLIDPALKRRMELLGATVRIVEDPAGSGAQRERLECVSAILEQHPGSFWPQQYDNPDNRLAYGRLAEWIGRTIGKVDCLVGGVGSGGSLCGTGSLLREILPELVVIAVDTHRSCLFGQPPGRRLLRGLGNSILPENLLHTLIDEVHWVGALPAFARTRHLYRDHALFMGPTSGAAALVADWYAQTHPDATTVVILPDEGHRYLHTVFNDDWLARLEGWPCEVPRQPVTLQQAEPYGEDRWTRMVWGRRPRDVTISDGTGP